MIAAVVPFLLLGCGPLPPAHDPVPGSRPGLGDDPVVIDRASVQAEAGLEAGRTAGAGFTAGELLLRLGILPGAEARLGLAHFAGGPGPATGLAFEDIEVGFKIRLTEGGTGPGAPALALLPRLSLPTGAARLSAGSAEPGALLLAGWDWPGLLELTANAGATLVREDGRAAAESFLSIALGRDLGERAGVELEVVRVGGGDAALRHAAVGGTWLVTTDLMLDVWAGVQDHGGVTTRIGGAGLSVRRPRPGPR
jgi:hypothetical protein